MHSFPGLEAIIPTLLFMVFIAVVSLFIEVYARHTGRWK